MLRQASIGFKALFDTIEIKRIDAVDLIPRQLGPCNADLGVCPDGDCILPVAVERC
jgi:hypothetical protein